MKFSECTSRQKRAWRNIQNAASYHIFGLMNGCQDNSLDSEEYKEYRSELEDLDGLIETVYQEGITCVYQNGGGFAFGDQAEKCIRDIRYCGKEFLMRIARFYAKKYQEEALNELGN